jgi:GNAT superfamily N-acetyltransferase
MPVAAHTIRPATEGDVPELLAMIRELADYEKALDKVLATEKSLLETLSFPSKPDRGYAKAILIFDNDNTATSDTSTTSESTTTKKGIPLAPSIPGVVVAPGSLSSTTSPNTGDASAPASAAAGFALFFNNYSTWRSAPGVYLEDLFVRPSHRGKGFGRALLASLAREALAVGGARLDWQVLTWNTPSIDFYESEAVGATRMREWASMRVEGVEALEKLGRSV